RGGSPGAGWAGVGEQFSRSWRDGEGFQLLYRSCPCGSRPPGPAMDVAPACSPARLPLLALADLPERT
uniref:Uncharacterized protein n=1 Tax=Panthera tigris altaica TaxID=74533 RepID=A0A8C9M3X2_PANTA